MSLADPDKLTFFRRTMSDQEESAFNYMVRNTGEGAAAQKQRVKGSIDRHTLDAMSALAKLPHWLADKVADTDRGFMGRNLTSSEVRFVKSSARRIAMLGVVPFLLSCQMGVTIQAVQQNDQIIFNVFKYHSEAPACIGELEVQVAVLNSPELWRISSADGCNNRFVYGVVPSGFSQTDPAPKLVAGRRYRVGVSGSGYNGSVDFVPGRDGVISE